MIKKFIVIILFILALHYQVNAETLTRAAWKADEELYKEENSFALKNYINIYQIPSQSNYELTNCSEWIADLYYYFITRLGLSDILAHYLVCPDGSVYIGAKQGLEREFKNFENTNSINIFLVLKYFNDETSIQRFANFLVDLASTNYIKPENVNFLMLGIETNPDTLNVKFKGLSPVDNIISNAIKNSTRLIKSTERKYKISLQKLTLSSQNPKPGDVVDVIIELKNDSSNNIYHNNQDGVFAYLEPASKTSLIYDRSWASLNSISLLSTDVFFKDTIESFTFKIKTPILRGKFSQKFELGINPNQSLSEFFTIDLNINTEGIELIEITNTETGRLKVRNSPNGNEVITYVYPKEKFIVLERQNSWIKITANEKTGWILGSYTRKI